MDIKGKYCPRCEEIWRKRHWHFFCVIVWKFLFSRGSLSRVHGGARLVPASLLDLSALYFQCSPYVVEGRTPWAAVFVAVPSLLWHPKHLGHCVHVN